MINNCKGKPLLTSIGYILNERWIWNPVKWTHCLICKLWHSNRAYPKDYLDCDWGSDIQDKTKAGILLIKNDKIFMTETYHTHMGFPKGEKEPYESVEECAEREFYEETGTKINLNDYNYTIIKINVYKVTYVFYVIRDENVSINTHPKDTKEITSYGWVGIKRIKYIHNISNISRIIIGLYTKHV
jgi:8-oxo-dGTP pyrophosphatase MutT (NUDIX family)